MQHTNVARKRCESLVVAAAVVWLASVAAPLGAQPQWRWPATDRVVVVADVHGAYAELVALLQAAGVVDAALDWSGGDTTLVSLGDLLDRGAESRKVMDLLMHLQRDAGEHGGAVHVVLGNHEAMNLSGDLRYVSAEEYAAFAAEEPTEVRAAAYARFLGEQPDGMPPEQARLAFERSHPPGYFAHQAAFRADGQYGAWLRSLPALIVVGDSAFVHGGLPAMVAVMDAGELNERVREGLRGSLGAPELGLDGPLWYRGSVYCNAFLEEPVLDAALAALDAARVVVGHTPTDDRRARALYDGRLVMLDTGMLAGYYAGRPAALVIEGEQTTVQYLAPDERLPPERGRIEAYGLSEAQLRAVLTQGAIEGGGLGQPRAGSPLPVDIRYDGNVVRALFYPSGAARVAELELAAHALDRLLGLNLVPPTVARTVDGRDGALQLVYPDAITEAERVGRNRPLGDWCPLAPQLQLVYAFDALTYNTHRTRDNVLFRREQPLLKLTDHARAFGTQRRLRVAEGTVTLSPELRAALAALDRPRLQAALGQWLDPPRIGALLERRDALLELGAAN